METTSRKLLYTAYRLLQKKIALLREVDQIAEDIEKATNEAYTALPTDYDPEDWLLIEKDLIAKWPDIDHTHIVQFAKIH